MLERKIYVLGDCGCGKSTLLHALTGESPVQKSRNGKHSMVRRCTRATVAYKLKRDGCFPFFGRVRLATKQKKVGLDFKECENSESRVRAMDYLDTDVVLVCFDINLHKTLQSVREFWLPEALYYAPESVPIILVGLKADVKKGKENNNGAGKPSSSNRRQSSLFGCRVYMDATQRDASKLLSDNNLFAYITCSGLDKRGIDDLKKTISEAATMQSTRIDSPDMLKQVGGSRPSPSSNQSPNEL